MLKIKIKYHYPDMPNLEQHGDWIDLRVCDILNLSPIRPVKDVNGVIRGWRVFKGDAVFISLGVSMELPEGYEAIIAPRSSLFKKHGLILTNSIGIIDNAYRGNGDIWCAYLHKIHGEETILEKYERILQFRIFKNMPAVYLEKIDFLNNKDREGFGSTDNSNKE